MITWLNIKPYIIVAEQMKISNSEAKRLIEQRAVKFWLDEEWLVFSPLCQYSPLGVWKVGKGRFFKLITNLKADVS